MIGVKGRRVEARERLEGWESVVYGVGSNIGRGWLDEGTWHKGIGRRGRGAIGVKGVGLCKSMGERRRKG